MNEKTVAQFSELQQSYLLYQYKEAWFVTAVTSIGVVIYLASHWLYGQELNVIALAMFSGMPLLVWVRLRLTKYRIRKGYFGTNQEETIELIKYALYKKGK